MPQDGQDEKPCKKSCRSELTDTSRLGDEVYPQEGGGGLPLPFLASRSFGKRISKYRASVPTRTAMPVRRQLTCRQGEQGGKTKERLPPQTNEREMYGRRGLSTGGGDNVSPFLFLVS